VIRGEKQAFDVERKFGSLKRRSNPFSWGTLQVSNSYKLLCNP
jgi:hypothetical protein